MSESTALGTPATLAGGLDLSAAMNAAAQLGKDGVEVIERLHAIHKEERAFNARGEFAVAMAALKSELPPITKTVPGMHGASRVGTRTKGCYAPIDTICEVLDPLCAKHGFSYRFDRSFENGKEWALVHVTHKGGHTETTRYPAMDDEPGKGKTPLHARGSGDTYARRYALTAAFAIVTADPDDDGKAASMEASKDPVKEADARALDLILDECPAALRDGERAALLRFGGCKSVAEFPAAKFRQAMARLVALRANGWQR